MQIVGVRETWLDTESAVRPLLIAICTGFASGLVARAIASVILVS